MVPTKAELTKHMPQHAGQVVRLYLRTNLTARQPGPLFAALHAAAHRIADRHGSFLALDSPQAKPRAGDVVLVDATLIPTPDR
ncbi:hypothetical protein ACIRL2_30185 [Embleya sp. NPDC127516]|uniref:hypothetical protein n=1 Tax=Embleya sp. NPDC127516 TaxID=3363990 RepID=UPI00381208E8